MKNLNFTNKKGIILGSIVLSTLAFSIGGGIFLSQQDKNKENRQIAVADNFDTAFDISRMPYLYLGENEDLKVLSAKDFSDDYVASGKISYDEQSTILEVLADNANALDFIGKYFSEIWHKKQSDTSSSQQFLQLAVWLDLIDFENLFNAEIETEEIDTYKDYYGYIKYFYGIGDIDSRNSSEYGINDNISRGDAAKYLYRFFKHNYNNRLVFTSADFQWKFDDVSVQNLTSEIVDSIYAIGANATRLVNSHEEEAALYGYGNGLFGPDDNISRGVFLTWVYLVLGSPKIEDDYKIDFTDVSANPQEQTSTFYEAVRWAVKNEITNGTSTTTFEPYSPLTKKQMAIFFYRIMRYIENNNLNERIASNPWSVAAE